MARPSSPRLLFARLVRRAAARRAAVAAGHARAPFRRGAAVAVAALALAGPAVAQQTVIPAGVETRVNTFTTDGQSSPSVARDADGDYVVAWQSFTQDGSGHGVYARRYNAAGVAQGDEFLVNTFTTGNQRLPSVAMDADGDFVVAWQSDGQDGSDSGVYAQRYNEVGVAQGGEFRVNTYTTGSQRFPSVALDGDGDFVVAWESNGQDGATYGVHAQRYDAAGVAQGDEFRVNTTTTGGDREASVAMDADGDFVIAWEGRGVSARRYNAAGVAQGDELQVSQYTLNTQNAPSVGLDADGDFVVAWESYAQDGSSNGIYAQRYAASGAPVGGELQVNTYTTDRQLSPTVAVDADGDVVVAWQSEGQDGAGFGVFSRRYTASGAAVGGEFQVNTYTMSDQRRPSVALDADGDLVVVWQSYYQDGDHDGVYAQRYAAGPAASEPGAPAGLTLALVPSPVGASGGHVRYETPGAGRVRVTVSDVLGREVAVLVDDEQGAGPHSVALDAGRLAPGVYVVRLEAGAATVIRRVTVAR
ncbi:MAG TPA: T9SS type A sorting domain-containing protein [Rubricoccaceae bacterium]